MVGLFSALMMIRCRVACHRCSSSPYTSSRLKSVVNTHSPDLEVTRIKFCRMPSGGLSRFSPVISLKGTITFVDIIRE